MIVIWGSKRLDLIATKVIKNSNSILKKSYNEFNEAENIVTILFLTL